MAGIGPLRGASADSEAGMACPLATLGRGACLPSTMECISRAKYFRRAVARLFALGWVLGLGGCHANLGFDPQSTVERPQTWVEGRVAGPQGPPRSLTFQPGEKLVYDLWWGPVLVGAASLEVRAPAEIQGQMAHHLVLTVSTNDFADAFYKVRDSIHSFVDAPFERSLLYQKRQIEGDTDKDIEVVFDYEAGEARYTNYGEPKEPVALDGPVFDPLSLTFAFRLLEDIEVGDSIPMRASDGEKVIDIEVKVLDRETLRVLGEELDTYKVAPSLGELGGVFKKSDDASLELWFSADERRIVAKISSAVIVGKFVGRLTEYQAGEAPPPAPTAAR